MEWFNLLTEITKEFWGRFTFGLIFVAAIAMILFLEKEKIKRYTFLWYTGLVLVFIYNPITVILSDKLISDSMFKQYYLRFFSVIPVIVIVAYGFTLAISKLSGVKKLIAVLVAIALISICGRCLYAEAWFTKADNRNKAPQDVITICDLFKDYEGEHIRILAPKDINVYLRQMDSRFFLFYGRDDFPPEVNALTYYDAKTGALPNTDLVADYCVTNDVDYIVVWAMDKVLSAYLDNGFSLYGRTANYAVLTPDNNWVLKEYDDAADLQGICYTMYNKKDGTLIVIDGGHAENSKTLRKAIKKYGNKVDAWILSHYHKDHVDAFNEIYADPQGITIDQIYVTPLDSEVFYSKAQEWDDVESFDRFMEITADADNINQVKRGDVLKFSDDLKITFLNAYEDEIKDVEDIPNNASLVFKMETNNRSALFCADCHSKVMAERLIKLYGDDLKADILQCGHHGNNSMPVETGFYEKVLPEVAIFDMPEDMLLSPELSAGALADYLQKMNCRIIWFNDKPNGFAFY